MAPSNAEQAEGGGAARLRQQQGGGEGKGRAREGERVRKREGGGDGAELGSRQRRGAPAASERGGARLPEDKGSRRRRRFSSRDVGAEASASAAS
jgi:hypothetical protein